MTTSTAAGLVETLLCEDGTIEKSVELIQLTFAARQK